MRESIGGTMLFWIVLFFMSIFITFLAAVIQYAKVYKIKNSMINYLEQGEGIASKAEFENVLADLGYPQKGKYVICRYGAENRGGYYYIKLYATFSVLNASVDVMVKGETRLIESGVYVKGNEWFQYLGTTKSCDGRNVSEAELTKVD